MSGGLLALGLALAPRQAPASDPAGRAATGVVAVRSRVRVAIGRDEVGPIEGSGFVVDRERGLVATNRHVAGEGVVLDLEVRFFDGTPAPAERVYGDPLHDFAFLRFDPKLAPPGVEAIALRERPARPGESVRMIGSNGGLASSFLEGTVSNLESPWDQDPGAAYLQVTISSTGGSSGSPLLDEAGAAVAMQTAHDERHSYALPADYFRGPLEAIRAGRAPSRGVLGLRLKPIDVGQAILAGAISPDAAASRRAASADSAPWRPRIAVVEGVVPDSPAQGAIHPGEVVLSVAGAPAGDVRAVERALDREVGRVVEVRLARAGEEARVALRVADLAQDSLQRLALFSGAAFHDVPYEFRARTDLRRQGVQVGHVAAGSAAEAADLRRDDIVLSVGGQAIRDVEQAWGLFEAAREGEKLLMVLRRPSTFDSATRTVVLAVDRAWDPARFLVRGKDWR